MADVLGLQIRTSNLTLTQHKSTDQTRRLAKALQA